MSWIYLPVVVEAARQGESCTISDTQTGVKSALSNTTSSVKPTCASECGTRSSPKRASGTMSPPSTLHPGLESFLACLRDTHARPGQQAGSTVEKKTRTTCGPMSFEYYGVLSQQNGASWRTHPCFVDLPITEESCPTWHPSGLMRSGKLARLPAWAATISAADSGSIAGGMWPTPTATERAGINPNTGTGAGLVHAIKMAEGVEMKPSQFPTPCARDHKGRTGHENQPSLPNFVADQDMLPTPLASAGKGCGPLGSKSHVHRLDRNYLDATMQEREQRTGSLNPGFVSHMMGWLEGWDCPEELTPDSLEAFDRKMLDGTWWTDGTAIPTLLPAREIPNRIQRLMALGNGWVPLCAAVAFMDLVNQAELICAHEDRD